MCTVAAYQDLRTLTSTAANSPVLCNKPRTCASTPHHNLMSSDTHCQKLAVRDPRSRMRGSGGRQLLLKRRGGPPFRGKHPRSLSHTAARLQRKPDAGVPASTYGSHPQKPLSPNPCYALENPPHQPVHHRTRFYTATVA